MAQDPSFDIVSKLDKSELTNAITQAMTEINTRFDFKGSKSEIKQDEENIVISSDKGFDALSEYTSCLSVLSVGGLSSPRVIFFSVSFLFASILLFSRFLGYFFCALFYFYSKSS